VGSHATARHGIVDRLRGRLRGVSAQPLRHVPARRRTPPANRGGSGTEISDNIRSFSSDLADVEPKLALFERELAEGKMPHLGIVMTNPSYDASEDATLLQAGGFELLDMPCIELLRKINNMQRALIATIHNGFELSLTELANHSSEDFYDPVTRQLKERYQWVPAVEHDEIDQAKALVAAEKQLLARIHAEQHVPQRR
jgi:hypothetical protein